MSNDWLKPVLGERGGSRRAAQMPTTPCLPGYTAPWCTLGKSVGTANMCVSAIQRSYLYNCDPLWLEAHGRLRVAKKCGRISLPRRIGPRCFVVTIRHPVSLQFLPELHRMSSSLRLQIGCVSYRRSTPLPQVRHRPFLTDVLVCMTHLTHRAIEKHVQTFS